MKTIALDNIEGVEYQDSLITKGHLSNIHVIFSKPGRIINYFGPGLRLALDLFRDQFPPLTEAERVLVELPVPTAIDFAIDTNTLEVSAPLEKLDGLKYVQLLAAEEQAKNFRYLLARGRSLNVDGLLERLQAETKRKKPHK